MPKKFPAEFKRLVVAVTRRGHLTQNEIASDFGVSETTLRRWLKQADIDEGRADGGTSTEQGRDCPAAPAHADPGAGGRDPAVRRAYYAKDALPNDLPAGS